MQPRIRTNTLTGYAGLARSLGLDPAALLADVHLELADLDVPGRWIPAGPAARLLELSAAQAGCPDFGLRMAALRRLGTLGPLSVVLRDEPDLRSAVDLLSRYERLYNEALHLRLREADGQATIEVWLEFGEPAPSEQALDLVMAALLGIIRALVRSDWQPRSASFARPAPPDPGPWRRLSAPGGLRKQVHRPGSPSAGTRGLHRHLGSLAAAVHPGVPAHHRGPWSIRGGHGAGGRRGSGGAPAAAPTQLDRSGEPVPGPRSQGAPAVPGRPGGDVLVHRARHPCSPGRALPPERAVLADHGVTTAGLRSAQRLLALVPPAVRHHAPGVAEDSSCRAWERGDDGRAGCW